MAIIQMQKLLLYTLLEDRDSLLEDLIKAGCFEITEPESYDYEELKNLITRDISNNKDKAEDLIEIINSLKVLDKYAPVKTGLFFQRHLVKNGEFNSPKVIESTLNTAKSINTIASWISEIWNKENNLLATKNAITPWINSDLPLNITETKEVDVFFGACPSYVDIDKMIESVYSIVPECSINIINSDKEQYYLTFIVHKEFSSKALLCAKGFDFGRILFNDTECTAREKIVEIDNRLNAISIEKEEALQEIVRFKEKRTDIEKCYDAINIDINKEKIRDKLVKTENILVLNGWVAVDEKKQIEKLLEKYICAYEFRDPLDEEEPPVKIKNSAIIKPFEVITELYSLPDPRGIDPNAAMSIFFFVCFGIMLSDAGYGLIIAGLCYYLLRKFRLRGMTKQLVSLLCLGGISTLIWGILFGSWFGDLVPVLSKLITGNEIIIKPLWFNPLVDPMRMLLFSFGLGLVHIFWGMALNAWMLIKRGKWLDAVFDIGLWYCLIIGLLVMLINFDAGKIISLIGALGLVLTQGRTKKGVLSKLTSGLLSLYGITSYLSDVLSYSRLLALGLATGVIASVINTMGSLLYGSMFGLGTILMVVIIIGGNLFNLAINTLGAYVHSSRLQYIEFFGKFYESGGVLYKPVFMDTKYVDILKEEN